MPNRVLREGIRSSEPINMLSDAGERLYVRLIVSADDYGLMEMSPAWCKANAVPLLDWSLPTVAKVLAELVDCGLLMPYEASGKRYAAIARWAQRIEAKYSRFPMPPWGRQHIVGGTDRSGRDRKSSQDAHGMPTGHPRDAHGTPTGCPRDAHGMPTPEERGTRNEERNTLKAPYQGVDISTDGNKNYQGENFDHLTGEVFE